MPSTTDNWRRDPAVRKKKTVDGKTSYTQKIRGTPLLSEEREEQCGEKGLLLPSFREKV